MFCQVDSYLGWRCALRRLVSLDLRLGGAKTLHWETKATHLCREFVDLNTTAGCDLVTKLNAMT